MRTSLLALTISVLLLSACGGGGGGSSGIASSTPADFNCEETETIGNITLCIKKLLVDGAASQIDLKVSGFIDLNGDGFQDLINSTSYEGKTNIDRPLQFLKATAKVDEFLSYSPTIIGGNASVWSLRKLYTGDFNGDGLIDFYPSDGSEYASDPSGWPFLGTNQYYYINKGNGQFEKVDMGIGAATAHGVAVGNSATDAFTFAINTPWNPYPATSKISIIKVNSNGTPQALQRIYDQNSLFLVVPNVPNANVQYGEGAYFYMISADVNKDGKKDIIAFSQNGATTGTEHNIFINTGNGFVYSGSFANNLGPSNVVEGATIADFNGDGYDDIAVSQVDRRTGSTTPEHSSLRIYINNKNVSFDDKTTDWIGSVLQLNKGWSQANYNDAFEPISVDVNGDGKSDLIFTHYSTTDGSPQNKVEILLNTGTSFTRMNFTKLASDNVTNFIGHMAATFTRNGKAYFVFNRNWQLYIGRLTAQ